MPTHRVQRHGKMILEYKVHKGVLEFRSLDGMCSFSENYEDVVIEKRAYIINDPNV